MRYTLLRNMRDLSSMALQIILPLVVIVILGSTLSAGFEDEQSERRERNEPSRIDQGAHPTPYPIIHEHRPLRAMDYYAVTVTVMMVMFGVVYAADSVVEQRQGRMAGRLAMAGMDPGSGRLGVLIATTLTVVIQGLTIVLFTGLVLRVPWWDEFPGVVVVIAVVAFFAGTAGVLIGETIGSYGTPRVVMQTVVFFWTFIAGGFVRFPVTSPLVRFMRVSSPAYHANRALLAMLPGMRIPGGTGPGGTGQDAFAQALPSIGLLLLAAVVLSASTVAVQAYRRRL